MGKIKSALQGILQYGRKHIFLSLIIIVGIIGGGYYLLRGQTSAIIPQYVLSPVTKGTLIVSISGSGQVAVSNQLEVKPKVAGSVTSLKVKEGDKVKAGTVIATLDSKDVQTSIRDAKLSLQSAQVALKKLQQPIDQLSLAQAQNAYAQATRNLQKLQEPPTDYEVLQAKNAITQAQRDLEQAKNNNTQQVLDTNQSLQQSYDDAYTTISNTYLDIPGMMNDLISVKISDTDHSDNVWSYKTILGENATVIQTFLSDYDAASSRFYNSFDAYKKLIRSGDQKTIYAFLDETLKTTEAISVTLEDARNLLDLIVNQDYRNFFIAPVVDNLRPRIQADISTINKDLSALRVAKDTIDATNQDTPINQQKSQDSVVAAEEKLKEKQKFLEDLLAPPKTEDIATAKESVQEKQAALAKLQEGPDELDLQNQKIAIQQKNNTLADAQAKLADYVITAPFDGTLAALSIQKNDTVSQGTSVATLITNQFIAEISLNEVDVAKVAVGNKVALTFDAIPDLSISGEVLQVDVLGTVTQGVVSYNVKVGFDTQDQRIKPGMTVSASIITDVKQDVLLVPSSAVKTQNDIHYVQTVTIPPNAQQANSQSGSTTITVTTKEAPQQKEVEIGLTNDTETEITSGLQEGDQVITQTLSSTSTSKPQTTGGLSILGGGGNRAGGGNFTAR